MLGPAQIGLPYLKDYPDKSINIVPDLVPYGPLWHDKIAANFAIHGDAFDFAMWDSQSTAEFAGGGHAYSVNKVFQDRPTLRPTCSQRFR